MIDSRNEVGTVLGAVNIEVPAALQQFRLTVGQVGAQNSSQGAFSNSLVELLQAAGEQGGQVMMSYPPQIVARKITVL